jgi:zinc protease
MAAPSAATGDEASVKAITDADIRADYAEWIRPDNAKIFVVSDKPLSEITPHLEAGSATGRAPSDLQGREGLLRPDPVADHVQRSS